MKQPINYRRFDYDRTLLPNRHLAELERDVHTLDEARSRSGLSVGYPGWNFLYYAALCTLSPLDFNVIVETGTNVGCSTIILAQALRDSGYPGHVYTIEQDLALQAKAASNIQAAGLGNLVSLVSGDSRQALPELIKQLSTKVRVAFLDASHLFDDAMGEFEAVLPVMQPDGIVIFDNTYPLADHGEDPRVYGVLKEIRKRHGGNIVNFPFASWCTPGIAAWQATAWPNDGASATPNTQPPTAGSITGVAPANTAAPSSGPRQPAHTPKTAARTLLKSITRLFPAVTTKDVTCALQHMIHLQATMEGRCCGDVGDRLAQYCAWIQYLRDRPEVTTPKGIEIGTLFGGSCLLMLNALQDARRQGVLTCIDPMTGYYDQPEDISGIPVSAETFWRNLARQNFDRSTVNLRCALSQSPAASATLTPQSVGVLLIDGDHSGKITCDDWMLYHPYVGEGGFVLFDDYSDPHWPEVTRTVDALIARLPAGWMAVGQLGTTFVLRKLPTRPASPARPLRAESTRVVQSLLEAFAEAEQARGLTLAYRLRDRNIAQLKVQVANRDTGIANLQSMVARQRTMIANRDKAITLLERIKSDYVQMRWARLAEGENIKQVLLFGAGKHTVWLLDVIRGRPGPTIVGILDDNAIPGELRQGLPVWKPGEAAGKMGDAIVLSTDTFQEEMRRRCQALFADTVQTVDLYLEFPAIQNAFRTACSPQPEAGPESRELKHSVCRNAAPHLRAASS